MLQKTKLSRLPSSQEEDEQGQNSLLLKIEKQNPRKT
jgi:hypothetical protein